MSNAWRSSFVLIALLLTLSSCRTSSDDETSDAGVDQTGEVADQVEQDVVTDVPPDISDSDTPEDTPFVDTTEVMDIAPDEMTTDELTPDIGDVQEVVAPPDWFAQPQGTDFQAQCPEASMQIEVLTPQIVRLKHNSPGATTPDYALQPQEYADVSVEWNVENDLATVTTDALTLTIRWPYCTVVASDSDGTVILDESGLGYFDGTGSFHDTTFETVGVRTRIEPQERFYGFGEKTGALNKRGRTLEFWNTDKPSYSVTQDPLYQSIPFYIGLREGTAYGVFVNNSHRMLMDVGNQQTDVFEVEAFGGEIDRYLIVGPGVKDVVRRYATLTGTQVMPPRWAAGYHQCRWSYTPDTRVLDVCQEFREREIPADGIWLDIDYMDGFRSWTWHPQDFSDPGQLVSDVEALGFKVTAIIDPGLKHDPGWDIYDEGLEGNHYLTNPDETTPYVGEVWPGPAVFPDFTRASTREWWGSLIHHITDPGVWGIWLDMNEPASFLSEDHNTVPGEVEANGDGVPTNMFAVHNSYALAECMGTYNGYRDHLPNQRPFLLTRAGFAGIQRYSAVWTGDAASNFPALADQLPMQMGLGLSGVANIGSDVGGWEGNPTSELFARWIAFGSLSPFYRTHVQQNSNDQEPWSYTEEVEDISRIHISERYRLLPYFYSLFYHAWVSGDPLLRPLFYEFQDDPETWEISDQVMLGPWILAAPVVTEGATSRTFYLPAGRWMEYHSGAVYEGPTQVTLDVTLQALPLYLREGAIVPKAPLMQYSDEAPVDPLILDLFPGEAKTEFVRFEDDGVSNEFESGTYRTTRYKVQRTEVGCTVQATLLHDQFTPSPRKLVLRIRPVDNAPTSVILNGNSLADLGSYGDIFEADGIFRPETGPGYVFDDNDRSIWVVFDDPGELVVEAVYDPALDALRPPVRVPVKILVPEGTPTTTPIHVGVSSSGWSPYPLSWGTEPNIAVGQLQVPRGEWFEYKYTRGDWDTAETWPDCQQADNRYEFGRAHPLKIDTVAGWADWCQ